MRKMFLCGEWAGLSAGNMASLAVFSLLLLQLWLLAGVSLVCSIQCNVKDYGAKGDGKNNDTNAFIKAFQACTEKGDPSTVYVPSGKYSLWPMIFEKMECSDFFFNVTGDLVAPSDPAHYHWVKNESFLLFKDCQNLTIHGWGAGSIDGQGTEWWDQYEKLERPKLLILDDCKAVSVRDIHLMNSPMFHIVPDNCEDVLIENVLVTAPPDSPNTDGIDPSDSRHVVIRNCTIGTGDDNVAVKPGCEDVLVENCLFQSGHGCSIGSINSTGVRDVVVKDITFIGTENGARIKTWQGGSGQVENISYINLQMDSVGLPIKINMFYCPDGGCHNHTQGVTIKDILFSGISGTQRSGVAGQLYCSDTVPCTHIHMENIDLQYLLDTSQARGDGSKFECWRAFGEASNVSPPSCLIPDKF